MTDLVAVLGARLDQFQNDLNQAGDMGDQAAARIESAFDNVNPNFAGLATLGLTAVGAATGILGMLTVLQKVNAELAAIGEAAKYLNTTTDIVQKLAFVGTSGGVSSDQSLKDLENVGKLLNDANINENSLTKLLKANNQSYKDRDGELVSINDLLGKGADLVKNAGSYADKVEIAKMLGLTKEWVPALEQGATGFKKIADSATDAGAVIDKQTIAKASEFDAAWKRSSAQLAAQFKSAAADVAGFLDDLISKSEQLLANFNAANGIKTGSGQAAFNAVADMMEVASRDAAGLAQNIDQVNRVLDYLKAKGADPAIVAGIEELRAKAQAAADALTAAAQAQSKIDFAGGVPTPRARPAAADDNDNPTVIPKRDTGENAFDRAENLVIKRTADLRAETEAVGQNTQAKVENKAIADLNTAAVRADITLSDEQRAKILALAKAEGEAAQALADRNQKQAQNNALLSFAGDQAISILDGLRTKSLTVAQAVTQLTNALITAIERAALLGTGPLAGLFGTAAAAGSGGTGGLLGLFSGGGSSQPSVGTTSAVEGGSSFMMGGQEFPAFAGGTDSAPGGLSMVGENGPELMNVPKGSQIIPNDVLRSMGGSGGGFIVNLIEDSSRAGQVQKTPSGDGFDIALFVDSITARNAANPGSATSAALASRGRLAVR